MIILQWPSFQVSLDKVHKYFKTNLNSNYDGLICDEFEVKVMFFDTPSSEEIDIVNNYWNSLNSNSFNPSIDEIIENKIIAAEAFGKSLIVKAAKENILMGITQAGKTKAVSDYFRFLQRYLKEGSLYAGLDEIDRLITEGVPTELAPYVTEARINAYKAEILTYLQV